MPQTSPCRTPGTICTGCKKPVALGALYTWGKGGRWHADCPSGTADTTPTPEPGPFANPVCPGCNLPVDIGPGARVIYDAKTNEYRHIACEYRHIACPAPAAAATKPEPVPEPEPAADAALGLGAIVKALGVAIGPEVRKHVRAEFNIETVRESLLSEVTAATSKIVAQAVASARIPITLEIRRGDTVTEVKGAHAAMPRLLDLVSRRKNVYLFGPPGSGKSTGAAQVAKALDAPYGYVALNKQTPDSRLLGYMDAGGTYRATPFRKIYEFGGVFCSDEMDNAPANLMTTLNGLLENGHGAFPDAIVPRHPDFVFVGTGNTTGRGGDVLFPERCVFDAAFMERFVYLRWEYDLALEESLTMARNPKAGPWLTWTRKAREFCLASKIRLFLSPRCSFVGAELLTDPAYSVAEVADAVAFRGIAEETKAKILTACPLPQVSR